MTGGGGVGGGERERAPASQPASQPVSTQTDRDRGVKEGGRRSKRGRGRVIYLK